MGGGRFWNGMGVCWYMNEWLLCDGCVCMSEVHGGGINDCYKKYIAFL